MTGRETLEQVREARQSGGTVQLVEALDAVLDGCVLLTLDEFCEALMVRQQQSVRVPLIERWADTGEGTREGWRQVSRDLLALLGGSDDVGPPPPGTGDDLPNPEIGMKC